MPKEQIVVTRGSKVAQHGGIAVVVISTNSDPLTKHAVESLIDNKFPSEIIVVNTGRGSLKETLNEFMDKIILVECEKRHYAGGARNLGIDQATSRVVSFLAADCRATPCWLSERMQAHDKHSLVPSALYPSTPVNGKVSRTAWASYFVTHFERIPGMPPALAKPFGLSYDRQIFEKHGAFDPTLRTGEDSEFNARIPDYSHLSPDTSIITLHTYPDSFLEALSMQYKRGVREYQFSNERYARNRFVVAGRSIKRLGKAAYHIMTSQSDCGRQIKRSMHIVLFLAAARVFGNAFSNT